ncbi:MAG: hypothetical protein ACO2ZM_04385 [Francisellaceae bacterium]
MGRKLRFITLLVFLAVAGTIVGVNIRVSQAFHERLNQFIEQNEHGNSTLYYRSYHYSLWDAMWGRFILRGVHVYKPNPKLHFNVGEIYVKDIEFEQNKLRRLTVYLYNLHGLSVNQWFHRFKDGGLDYFNEQGLFFTEPDRNLTPVSMNLELKFNADTRRLILNWEIFGNDGGHIKLQTVLTGDVFQGIDIQQPGFIDQIIAIIDHWQSQLHKIKLRYLSIDATIRHVNLRPFMGLDTPSSSEFNLSTTWQQEEDYIKSRFSAEVISGDRKLIALSYHNPQLAITDMNLANLMRLPQAMKLSSLMTLILSGQARLSLLWEMNFSAPGAENRALIPKFISLVGYYIPDFQLHYD